MARGCFVLLAGPDGSGKTTIGDALDSLATADGVRLHRAHYRPGVVGGRPAGSNVTVTPHAQRPRGYLPSLVKILLVAVDMSVGYLLVWRPARRQGVLLVERGWWDMAVDPVRYRLDARIVPVIRWLGRLLPRPDLMVLLGGDADAIDARKQEIGADEIHRQLASWEGYSSRAARRVLRLDTVTADRRSVAATIMHAVAPPTLSDARRVPFTPDRLAMTAAGAARPAGRLYEPFHPVRRVLKPIGVAAAGYGLAPRATEPFEVRELCAALDIACAGYAVLRSSYPGRWLVGVCSGGRMTTVIKVATEPDRPLQKEIATLLRLQLAPPRSFDVPVVRWSGTWRDNVVLAVEAFGRTQLVTQVEDVVSLCDAMVNGEQGMRPVVHGDLAPWNVRLRGGRPVVLDWEAAYPGRAPLRDLAHFVISSGALLTSYTPAEAFDLLCADGSPGARHLRAVGEAPEAAPDFLRRYLRTAPITSDRIAEFRTGLEQVLAGGSAR